MIEVRLANNTNMLDKQFDDENTWHKEWIDPAFISRASIAKGVLKIVINGLTEYVHPDDVRDLLKAKGIERVTLKGVLRDVVKEEK